MLRLGTQRHARALSGHARIPDHGRKRHVRFHQRAGVQGPGRCEKTRAQGRARSRCRASARWAAAVRGGGYHRAGERPGAVHRHHRHAVVKGRIESHLLKCRARDAISREEEAFVRAGVKDTLTVAANRIAVPEGKPIGFSTILVSGIAARRKDMRDGRRQYTELHVPGDFTDLHSFTLKHLDHDIVALSNCTFAVVPHEHLKAMTERFPHLTRVYWFGPNLDACIHREWELSLGSRSAIASMAHLFCELNVRLEIVELARDGVYDFPISQQELGEMIGIT